MAIQDHFLKIDGIDGESSDSKHKGEIEILSFKYGAEQTGTSASGGGAGKGRVKVQDFVITKSVDKATPKLFQGCCTGEIYKTALLTVRKAGKDQQEYFTVKLSDVLVSAFHSGKAHESIDAQGQQEWIALEEVHFNYSKIELGYKAQKADGTLEGEMKGGWDVKGNVKT